MDVWIIDVSSQFAIELMVKPIISIEWMSVKETIENLQNR